MKELVATMSSKGQVTVPVEVRKSLGLNKGDKVAFHLEDEEVRISRKGSIVAATAGMLKNHTSQSPQTAEGLRVAAEEAIAADAIERARAQPHR